MYMDSIKCTIFNNSRWKHGTICDRIWEKTLRMGFFVKTEFDASLISSTLVARNALYAPGHDPEFRSRL